MFQNREHLIKSIGKLVDEKEELMKEIEEIDNEIKKGIFKLNEAFKLLSSYKKLKSVKGGRR